MLKRPTHYRTATRHELSERQREVLALIAEGKTNPEIADQLSISLDGAKFHVREILAKLNVESREEAAAIWRDERRPAARVASFLRGISPFGVLKPAGVLAAVAGIGLGSMALTVALTQDGGGDREPAVQDAGGAGIGATATPTPEGPVSASAPGACNEDTVEWQGETRKNDDGSVRLDIYARALAVGTNDSCTVELDVTLTPAYLADPNNPGSVAVFARPVSEKVTEEIGGWWSPVLVTSSTNVCKENYGSRIYLVWNTPSGRTLGTDFEIATPSCVDAIATPTFTVAWWRLLSSTLPRMTPVPTPTTLAPRTPDTLAGRCGSTSCPDAAAFEQSPDFTWFDEQPNGFLDACGPAASCMKVYVLEGGSRTAVTVPEFETMLAEVKANALQVMAIGDSGNGAIDVYFSTKTGPVSIALTKVNGEWRASGLKRWPDLPQNGAQGEASFGSAVYYHVGIKVQ